VSLRRQPTRIVGGRAEGGFTAAVELVCRDCGDHPDLDYSEISSRLQQIRGPYPVLAALAALEEHLGLAPDVPGRPFPRGGGARSPSRWGPGSGNGRPVAR